MTRAPFPILLTMALTSACTPAPVAPATAGAQAPNVYAIQEGYVDVGGMFIYYEQLGTGEPLVILHGGPGASHDYLLPYLIPLAKTHRLILIDERGSGKSTKLDEPAGYTVDAMVEDVEAVRRSLNLGKIDVLGHSYGGVLAQAYALKYQDTIGHLILASTFHSTRQLNETFKRMLAKMTPELRGRIEAMEKAGLYGHGKEYEKSRYESKYMAAPPRPQLRPIGQWQDVVGSLSRDVGLARRVCRRRQSQLRRIRRPAPVSPCSDPDPPRRPRRMRARDRAGHAEVHPRLEARHAPAERAHDLRRSADAVPEGGRGVPRWDLVAVGVRAAVTRTNPRVA